MKKNLLKDIIHIENLNIYNMESVISYFSSLINNFSDDYLFIFNIEPRGQTKRQLKFYPNPNICIPGGNMEIRDNLSFEKCAIREFQEETGIQISMKYKIIGRHNINIIKKYYKNVKFKSYKGLELQKKFSYPDYEKKDFNDWDTSDKNLSNKFQSFDFLNHNELNKSRRKSFEKNTNSFEKSLSFPISNNFKRFDKYNYVKSKNENKIFKMVRHERHFFLIKLDMFSKDYDKL